MVAHPTARSGLASIEDLQVAAQMHQMEVRAVDPREISTLGWWPETAMATSVCHSLHEGIAR